MYLLGPSQSISGLLSDEDKIRLMNISKENASINVMYVALR